MSRVTEEIGRILTSFHRNSCYPEAMSFEVNAAVDAIEATLRAEAAIAGAGEQVAWAKREHLEMGRHQFSTVRNPTPGFDVPLYLGPALASPTDREAVAVTDEMVEQARRIYDTASNGTKRNKAMRRILQGALALSAPGMVQEGNNAR